MRHACHKPRNPGLMSARRFKRDERDDGMQTLLGVPAGYGGERGKNRGRGVEARRLRQVIALRKAELQQRRGGTAHASGQQIEWDAISGCLFGLPAVLSLLFNLKEQRTR